MNVLHVGLLLTLSIASCVTPTKSLSPALILTPLIKQNKSEEARNQSLVNPALFLNTTSYSGFLTVDEKYGSNTFFWYFPAADSKKTIDETPWIVWLQGGPGGSSLIGLFDEMGPFQIDDQANIKKREWTWNKEHSMLFIDNPIGAGYSFTNSEMGFARDSDTYGPHLYTALQQFLTIFPELRKAPLYLAGESYAGRYVPAFAMKILQEKPTGEKAINLQGLIMGNPVLNRESVSDYTSVFYNWGLVDSQGALAVKPLQDEYTALLKAGDNKNASVVRLMRDKLLHKLQDLASQDQIYNLLADGYNNLHQFENYLAKEAVREALHVGDIKFAFNNASVSKPLLPDFLSPVRQKVETLLEHYRILIYCGQLDLTAPCVPNAEARRRTWHWSRKNDFLKSPRVPWAYNESVAGYVKSGGGLTEVLVRGAGHLVPIEKPAPLVQLISYFIRGLDLPTPTNYVVDTNIPEYEYVTEKSTSYANKGGLVASAIINVVLVLIIIVGGIMYYISWRKRRDSFYYMEADNISDDFFMS